MRFALIATAIAAAIAVPLGVAAAGPQMSEDQFISAVRCTAYADVSRANAALGEEKWLLNAEARRQAPETAAQARAEVGAIAQQAQAGALPGTCSDAQLAAGAQAVAGV
jgi:hypothetical protein